jgi:CheY-like chemotaxis protein
MNLNSPILIVEDSDEDYEVTSWALRQAGVKRPIVRAARSSDALRILFPQPLEPVGSDRTPCLVLLDLNLPGNDGRYLLGEIRQAAQPPAIPIVILSTSNNPRDIEICYKLGAAGFINKPMSLDLYAEKMRLMVQYWFNTVTLLDDRL